MNVYDHLRIYEDLKSASGTALFAQPFRQRLLTRWKVSNLSGREPQLRHSLGMASLLACLVCHPPADVGGTREVLKLHMCTCLFAE